MRGCHETTHNYDREQKRQKVEISPNEVDILFFGDAHLTCIHPGNITYAHVVRGCLNQYRESNDLGKFMICHGIIDAFTSRLPPVRFLLRNDTTRDWVRLSQQDALVATVHAFMTCAAQQERLKVDDEEIDAMIVSEFPTDGGEQTDESASSKAEAEEHISMSKTTSNDIEVQRKPDVSTIDACNTVGEIPNTSTEAKPFHDVKVSEQVCTPSASVTTLNRPLHARLVSIDFEMTPLHEVRHDSATLQPYHSHVSFSTSLDVVEPICDGRDSPNFWEELDHDDFEELKDALECDQVFVS